MKATAPLILLFVASCPAWETAARADEGAFRQSIVKIITTQRLPNLHQPWTKHAPSETGGSGFVIAGNRILTNHHVIAYHSQIYVQPYQSSERIAARLIASSPQMDLAVLSLDDEAFFQDRPVLPLDEGTPRTQSVVNLYGYPIGGNELSITEGIVSRVEYTYYHFGGAGLQTQIDAAINPGNSGGPALSNGKVVGMAFRHMPSAENIGYLIPAEEIRTFLDDTADGKYDGKPQLLNAFQSTDNEALRQKFKLPSDVGGCLLTHVTSRDADYPLQEGDVVTRIGPHDVDRSGQVRYTDDIRVYFTYYVPKLSVGGKVPLTVLRAGEKLEIEVPTVRERERLAPHLLGTYLDYFVFGPLTFCTASYDYTLAIARQEGMAEYLTRIESPLITRGNDSAQFDGERMVVIPTQVFSHRISKGYTILSPRVLARVNGLAVKNLTHLVEMLRDSKDEFLEFEFAEDDKARFVFRRQEMLDATDEILTDNGIRNQCSPTLQPLWTLGQTP